MIKGKITSDLLVKYIKKNGSVMNVILKNTMRG